MNQHNTAEGLTAEQLAVHFRLVADDLEENWSHRTNPPKSGASLAALEQHVWEYGPRREDLVEATKTVGEGWAASWLIVHDAFAWYDSHPNDIFREAAELFGRTVPRPVTV